MTVLARIGSPPKSDRLGAHSSHERADAHVRSAPGRCARRCCPLRPGAAPTPAMTLERAGRVQVPSPPWPRRAWPRAPGGPGDLGPGRGRARRRGPRRATVRPIRAWFLLLPASRSGWVGAELAGVWLVVVVGAAGGWRAAGGAAAPPGWVGLALALGAAGAFARQVVLAHPRRKASSTRTSPARRPPRAAVAPAAAGPPRSLSPGRPGRRAPRRPAVRARRGPPPPPRRLHAPRRDPRRSGADPDPRRGLDDRQQADQGRSLMNRLARSGWVCVAINYRLSPRVRHPTT